MPEADSHMREGQSDALPIHLEGLFTVRKIDHLLNWFYRYALSFCDTSGLQQPHTSHRLDLQFPPIEALTSILELATFLEMDHAHAFVIQALSGPTLTLSPALRLSLAISFRIKDWIEPAFNELLTIPAHGGYSESSDICTCRLFCLYFIVHVDICCMCDSL